MGAGAAPVERVVSEAERAALAKQKAMVKALMHKYPLTACTSTDSHMMSPMHDEAGGQKTLAE